MKTNELNKIAKDLSDFEKNQFKNDPGATIKAIIKLEEGNNFTEQKLKNEILNYDKKTKDQKLTKEDM